MFGCLYVQVLVREENPGIHYRFNPPLNREPLTGFAWHYNSWSRCSALCAGGRYSLKAPECFQQPGKSFCNSDQWECFAYCFCFAWHLMFLQERPERFELKKLHLRAPGVIWVFSPLSIVWSVLWSPCWGVSTVHRLWDLENITLSQSPFSFLAFRSQCFMLLYVIRAHFVRWEINPFT